LGALPGVIAAFQSWDDEMKEHCHIHLIVTAGGLTEDNRWIDVKNDFLVWVPVLASKFRGKFLAYLREALNPLTKRNKEKPAKERLYPPPGMSNQKCPLAHQAPKTQYEPNKIDLRKFLLSVWSKSYVC